MTSTTELTSSPLVGRSMMRGAATGKARLPTVESLTEDTTRRLVPAERSVRRPCRYMYYYLKPADPGIEGRSHVILCTSARQLYIQSAVRRAANEFVNLSGVCRAGNQSRGT